MKLSLNDFVQSHAKTSGLAVVEKYVESLAQSIPEPLENETFSMSITGGEIHRGEPVVDRLKRFETLQEKIARFDRLAESVAVNRMRMIMMQGGVDPDEEDPNDFSFEEGQDFDAFGDPIVAEPKKPASAVPPKSVADVAGDEPASASALADSDLPSRDNEVVDNN